MPIDTSIPRTPGWWLKRLFVDLGSYSRQRRLGDLRARYDGNPPLPAGAEAARESFAAFQRRARTNFAELVVAAVSERMNVTGFRTAADSDETGDAELGAMWERAGMAVTSAEATDTALNSGESYMIVGPVDEETGAPSVTAEDPRYCYGLPHPNNPHRLMAFIKVQRDPIEGVDRAHLFLPGDASSPRARVLVASRRAGLFDVDPPLDLGSAGYFQPNDRQAPILGMFSEQTWSWDDERSGELPHGRLPVVRFRNKDGAGEYEKHIDLLDRINQEILNRMVIAIMQAFRQRAVRGLPLTDDQGNEIDYSKVFTADPAAIWQLPGTAEMWESQVADIRPILEAIKDDARQLGVVTRTPLYMLAPDGANQSAEGASLSREGLVFKVEDRQKRWDHPHAQVASLMLLQAGQHERADLAKIRTIWAPAERLSLTERATAAAVAANQMPRRTLLRRIWGFSPEEAERAMTDLADEALLAGAIAGAAANQSAQGLPVLGPVAPVPSAVPPAAVPAGSPERDVVPVPAVLS